MGKDDGDAYDEDDDREVIDHRGPDKTVAHEDADHIREGRRQESGNGTQCAAG